MWEVSTPVPARTAKPTVKPRKLCVVGSTGHRHVTCTTWDDVESVNLVDFECVVIVLRTLPVKYWYPNPAVSKKIRVFLSRLLASNGGILVLGDHEQILSSDDGSIHTNYLWSPVAVKTKKEAGNTIEIKENLFPKLFSRLKQWDFYYSIPDNWQTYELELACEVTKYPDSVLKPEVTHLVGNRYRQPLGASIHVHRINRRTKAAEKMFGFLALLPCIRELEDRQAVNLLLEDLLELPQENLPPAWVENVPMPQTPEIQAVIDSKTASIRELEAEIVECQREKQEIDKFKKLLYGDGKELEEIFALCLEKLGGTVKPATYSEEEFILEYKGGLFLIECKGVGKSIALTHVRQLADYMFKFEEDEGKAGKGILFGNTWKGLPLEERGNTSAVIFPDNVYR